MAWAGPGVAVDSGTEDTPIVINSSSGEEEEEEEEEEREFRMHLSEVSGKCVYGTSLIWTPMGQKKVSLLVLVRCPHFRG